LPLAARLEAAAAAEFVAAVEMAGRLRNLLRAAVAAVAADFLLRS
jgi:hypothetical protein